MNIYPAIDIKSGKCVRLYQGSFDLVTQYANDPLAVARSFAEQGATFLHIVDLDGAQSGQSMNTHIIETIAKESGLFIQTGGGIRTKTQIEIMLSKGIQRVVLGSIAISEPQTVKEWLQVFGSEKIVLAFDIRIQDNNPICAIHGWQTSSTISLWEILTDYQNAGLKHVLCTDIERDGTLSGPNIDLYQTCKKRFPGIALQASGGISSLNDLSHLLAISIEAVIIGKAFYEKRFSLGDALLEVQAL